MLQLRPNCELCDADLPPAATDARICSYECTFCERGVTEVLGNAAPPALTSTPGGVTSAGSRPLPPVRRDDGRAAGTTVPDRRGRALPVPVPGCRDQRSD